MQMEENIEENNTCVQIINNSQLLNKLDFASSMEIFDYKDLKNPLNYKFNLSNNKKDLQYITIKLNINYSDISNNCAISISNPFDESNVINKNSSLSNNSHDVSRHIKIFTKSSTIKIKKSIVDNNTALSNILSKLSKETNKTNIYEIEFNYLDLNIELKQILDCIELLLDKDYKIEYSYENIIQYLQAFTLFEIKDKQREAIDNLLTKLNNENIVFFVKYVNNLYNEYKSNKIDIKLNKYNHSIDFLLTYTYWLINYLVLKSYSIKVHDIKSIKFDKYCFDKIVRFNSSNFLNFKLNISIYIEKNSMTYKAIDKETNKESNIILSNLSFILNKNSFIKNSNNHISSSLMNFNNNVKCSLDFLNEIKCKIMSNYSYFYCENNFFNTGKVIRWKTDDSFFMNNDYPHYFQMKLDNDPDLVLYAIRESENSNFIISKNKSNFNKFSEDYIAEVVTNFWGTQFDIYDNGIDKNLIDKLQSYLIFDERKILGKIIYDTNIMGECPRYFKSELYTGYSYSYNEKDFINENSNRLNEKKINKNCNKQIIQKHELKNLEPEWNIKMNCYCLNFYGRVKKASARNFQMIYPEDSDNILFQHGKENHTEFNIDFREPFNYVTAFAHSLVSIGRKRVVS